MRRRRWRWRSRRRRRCRRLTTEPRPGPRPDPSRNSVAWRKGGSGPAGGRTWPSGSGARSARTTRRTATAWDYFPHDHARSRAYRWGEDGLLGICDDQARPLLRARPLERQRPDPQGAPLRPDRQRGQPRRGRQGALLLPRRHAEPRLPEGALQVPAARPSPTPSWSPRTGGAAGTSPSTSCSTPASSPRTATSTSWSSTPRPAPDDILIRITATNRGPDPAPLAPAADPLVPQHLGLG